MNLARIQERIGGPRAVSWASFLVLAPLAALSNLFRVSSLPSPIADRFLFVILTACAAAAVIGCLWALFKLRPQGAILPLWLVLGAYAVIGILRSFVPTLGEWLGVLPAQTVTAVDVVQAVVACVIMFSLVAFVLDGLDRQQQAVTELDLRSTELDRLRRGAASRLRHTKTELEQRIDTTIVPMLTQFVDSLDQVAEAGAAPDQLRASAERMRTGPRDAVGSLGRNLSSELAQPVAEPAAHDPAKRLRWSGAIRGMTSGDPFAPVVGAVLIFLAFLGASVNHTDFWPGIAIAAAMGAINFVVTAAIQRWYPRFRDSRWRTPIWIGAVLVAGVLTSTPYLFLSRSLGLSVQSNLIVLMVVVWFSALIALAKSASAQLLQTTRALQTVNESYRAEAAGLDEATTALRRRIGTVLHGELQGRLVANALRLDLAARLDQPAQRVEAVNQVIDDLDDIRFHVAHLTSLEIATSTLRANLHAIRDRWAGVVDIDVSPVSDELETLLADECASITEIVREGVNNAAKHGAATRIGVRIQAPVEVADRVEILIEDNGTKPVSTGQTPDLRPTTDLQPTSQELVRQHGLTRLRVVLPLSPANPAAAPQEPARTGTVH